MKNTQNFIEIHDNNIIEKIELNNIKNIFLVIIINL